MSESARVLHATRAESTVEDLMSRPVLTVHYDESLWDAWQLLFVSGLRHLVAMDDTRACLGVLSDRNILSDLPMTPEHLQQRSVGDVLARVPVLAVHPEQTPGEAAALMHAHAVEALPVLDGSNRLVGIITETDLVRWIAEF